MVMGKGQAPRGTQYRKAYAILVIFAFVVTASLIRGLLSELGNSDELVNAGGDYQNAKQDDLADHKTLPDKQTNNENTQGSENDLTDGVDDDENVIIVDDDDRQMTNEEDLDNTNGNKAGDAGNAGDADDVDNIAVSDNHFCPLTAWIYHMYEVRIQLEQHQRPRLLVYDLGLLPFQQDILNILYERGYVDEVRVFDYGLFPDFFNVNVSRGEYAWKPVIVAEIARDYPGVVFWLDSGTFISPIFLRQLKPKLNSARGFLSPRSVGVLARWTHPGVFKYYNVSKSKYRGVGNCNGAVVIFDTNRVQNIIDDWEKCARVKDCIAPPGSSRDNHRQDQAILTLVAANHNYFCTEKTRTFRFATHQDISCLSNIAKFERKHPLTWTPTDEVKEYIAEYIKNFFVLHPDTDDCYNPWTDAACPDSPDV
ncbi:3876_t:CDS:2 [Paraglomus occultum]|uniref:3876_t:CDS:1 n=1 Tax=Paraglomus occultum TaxID=144539 RepID=A0A9N8YVZ9_9GLOM|nr:3876_t:CDS:2 [Paraglomus occultum]